MTASYWGFKLVKVLATRWDMDSTGVELVMRLGVDWSEMISEILEDHLICVRWDYERNCTYDLRCSDSPNILSNRDGSLKNALFLEDPTRTQRHYWRVRNIAYYLIPSHIAVQPVTSMLFFPLAGDTIVFPLDSSHLQECSEPSYLIWEWRIKTNVQLISYQLVMLQAPQMPWNSWIESIVHIVGLFWPFCCIAHDLLYTVKFSVISLWMKCASVFMVVIARTCT